MAEQTLDCLGEACPVPLLKNAEGFGKNGRRRRIDR